MRGEVALVHDFFVQDGGAERCAIELARLLPSARVHTSFFDRDTFSDRLDPARVRPWPVERLLAGHRFRSLLPLYPLYFAALDLRSAELVVSSSVAFTNAVRTARRAFHVSYVHTPMRYAWQLREYLAGSSYRLPIRAGAHLLRPALERWDRHSASRPHLLVANSATVRQRIREHWGRDAEVIHPPVDVGEFRLSTRDDGYLLVAARLVAYRRIDIAIAAARALGRELVVVGDGPERARLESQAGPGVRFVGHQPRASLVELYEGCHAYLVPGIEDFGISVVEAMACGKPVVAYGRGGATETVVDGVTGILFEQQSAPAMAAAIERLDGLSFDPLTLRQRALRFDRHVFIAAWRELLTRHGFGALLAYAASDGVADRPVAHEVPRTPELVALEDDQQ